MELLQYRNLYVLPYQPLSLASTVFVRRALEHIRPGSMHDVVALPYPVNAKQLFMERLAELPDHPTAMVSEDANGRRCLVPVFVHEPPVEAARFAMEHGVEIAYIGGHVAMKREEEIRYELPVEAGLLGVIGVKPWMDIIRPWLREPGYDVRDRYDLAKMAELCKAFDRVVMPVHVQDLDQLKSLLDDLLSLPSDRRFDRSGQPYTISVADPKGTELYPHYMGPMPGLSSLYEEMRAAGRAAEYDPHTALVRTAMNMVERDPELRTPIEAHRTFQLLIDRTLATKGVTQLSLAEVLELACLAYGKPFSDRLHRQLLTYRESAPRVIIHFTEEERKNLRFDNIAWPPHKFLMSRLRRRIHKLVDEQPVLERRSHVMRGSLEKGIDVRATMRAAFLGDDRLCVRAHDRTTQVVDDNEPIVMLFPQRDLDPRHAQFCSTWVGQTRGSEQYTGVWQYCTSSDRRVQNGYLVRQHFNLGMVVFCDPLLHLDRLKESYRSGDEMRNRVPIRRLKDPVLCDLEEKEVRGAIGWMEALFTGAFHYAQKAIVVMLPQGQVLPAKVNEWATRSGKGVILVDAGCLTNYEASDLRYSDYSIQGPHLPQKDDRNDVGYLLDLEERFRDLIVLGGNT
ncbi:MAG: hypothetical protein IPI81_01335 [Flavobacteriales bacterium]|nr:hypothetical protein [Flavobacteriales bacterium]MCC6939322.1 hypothetical protein [Flavobacteriales bacterium]